MQLSFQKIATVPASGLVAGRIYFETSTGMIKVATSATAVDKFGDGVKSASWDKSAKTLKIINESGEEISLNLSDVASASAVSAELDAKATVAALNAVKATAEAAAPKDTTYTKTEVDNKVASAVGSVYKMKGSVDNVTALTALTGVVIGDVYNVVAAGILNGEAFEAGSNFVAIEAGAGSKTGMWDKLGGTIDLSDYTKKTEVPTLTAFNDLTTTVNGKVTANANITAGTKCKITYDAKGLVTAGANLEESDIPTLAISKISGLDTALNGKVPTTRTVNSKPLSDNVVLAGADILVGGDGIYSESDLQAAIEAMDGRITSAAASGVQSFGGQTEAITVDTANTTDGQVKFSMSGKQLKGTVNGLKSAAYTESSAYATFAQGTKADSAIQAVNGTASNYITTSKNGTTVTVTSMVQAVASASSSAKGLAEASDVKAYADGLMTWAEFE